VILNTLIDNGLIITCLLLDDHEEGPDGLAGNETFFLANCENITWWRPGEVADLLWRVEADHLNIETALLALLDHFVDVDTVTLGVDGQHLFTGFSLTFG